MNFDIPEAREFLLKANVFFWADELIDSDEDDSDKLERQSLNMNDTFAWALAWSEHVPDEDLPAVAKLFWKYGWCGLLYWVSERNENIRSEFTLYNRMIDFVRAEEQIEKEIPSLTDRAYTQREYVIKGEALEQ